MSNKSKILIVDDENDIEQLVRQKFRRQVREGEMEIIFAKNGRVALEKIRENPETDVIFSDINMPEMDGLTLLKKTTELYPLLKTVMISAYSDMENIRLAMNLGAFDFICKPFQFEDFERTLHKALRSVEQVKGSLRAVRENNILKMYVDEGVLKFMGSREFEHSITATETDEATIVFVDICGFTAFSEREDPDNVIRFLNAYFDLMVQEIIAENGYVDKFIGDAVLAVFRGVGHTERAIRAALSIHKRLLEGSNNFTHKVSIGVNSGQVIFGNVGCSALRRFDFTVIGDVVNTAQRLQIAALPGQVLVNETTRKIAGPGFVFEKIGEMELKNKANPEVVFAVGHAPALT